jgi:GxxExxY protein
MKGDKRIFGAELQGKRVLGELNILTEQIIGAAIEVHRHLGPGLLESTYEACLKYELEQRGLLVQPQKALPVVYKEIQLEQGYRIDLLVANTIIVELKVVEEITAVHEAQILTYLKLSGHKIGLLFNFNVKLLKNGIRRFIMS